MRQCFLEKGLNAGAKLGGLFSYDVKVKEGYVCDTFKYIGYWFH